jgi:hypothetical protein
MEYLTSAQYRDVRELPSDVCLLLFLLKKCVLLTQIAREDDGITVAVRKIGLFVRKCLRAVFFSSLRENNINSRAPRVLARYIEVGWCARSRGPVQLQRG